MYRGVPVITLGEKPRVGRNMRIKNSVFTQYPVLYMENPDSTRIRVAVHMLYPTVYKSHSRRILPY